VNQTKSSNGLLKEVNVINVGLKNFSNALSQQETNYIHVNWRPPAVTDKRVLDILSKLK